MFFLISLGFLNLRLYNLQYKDRERYNVMANMQHSYVETTRDLNYKLLDCNGDNLLKYKEEYKAVIIPKVFIKQNEEENYKEYLKIIEELELYNEGYNNLDITSNAKHYFTIDLPTYEKIKDIKNIKGFYTFKNLKVDRSEAWSLENMITTTKNISSGKEKSLGSLEMTIRNKLKNNKNYTIEFEKDVDNNILNIEENIPKNNLNVKLNLDRNIQEDIKELLKSKYGDYEQIGVILMESNSGNIKAMVQKDDTLPNINIGAETLNGFFPGSIYKTLVMETILEKDNDNVNKSFSCKGLYEDNNKGINHGSLNINDAFVVSCNHIFSQLGIESGFQSIHSLSKSQGLLDKVLNLDREQSGKFEVEEPKMENGSLGLTAIGQNMRITPIEAISIANTVINEGIYIKPNIISAYVDNANKVVEKTEYKGERCISKETALNVKKAMNGVVNKGTAREAYLEDIDIGGKTGSTERLEIVKDRNGRSKRIKYSDGWFIGFFNKEDKYYSMVVFVKNINKDSESGGNTAAPIFKDVVKIFLDEEH
ncbi:penicillin-binding transpeptidase domain-containing protein [Clostridium tetani]|uniref:penicillin-binding transpeptidase domain-containing protein n=1 Tax=Clostridium tetani TaxID=1513 RepID=UPI001FB19298|nr:penicillin-binding transpeptidase domain-containing protein [Clostridium tetani]